MIRRFGYLIVIDGLLVALSFYIALPARFAGRPPQQWLDGLFALLPLAILVFLVTNFAFGLYNRIWRYATTKEFVPVSLSVAVATIILAGIDLVYPGVRPLPLGTIFLAGFFALTGFLLARYGPSILSNLTRTSMESTSKVLIVGAGQAGHMLGAAIQDNLKGQYQLIGYIDDDPSKKGMHTRGVSVIGDRRLIPQVVDQFSVDLIAIAMINIADSDFREIIELCESTNAAIKSIPNLLSFAEGQNSGLPLRDVTAEDLLGRGQAVIDQKACSGIIQGKVILITGAAGSIGSELCLQIADLNPEKIIALDNNESGLFDLQNSFKNQKNLTLVPLVADITDKNTIDSVFKNYQPVVVFHAAAYKHVPLMQIYPHQAIRVNVLGTIIIADAAKKYGTEIFIMVSTDKAVEPSSVMGATKRLAEMVVLQSKTETVSKFSAVRFGNVLRSRGSVVPTFEKQIDSGGPVTVTHKDMERYFMSISEAVRLMIQAAANANGGELFMLDMGNPISIDQLAHRLIRLRGLRPGVDIAVEYVGKRPGEKVYEKLIGDTEELIPTSHQSVFRVESAYTKVADKELNILLDSLKEDDKSHVINLLQTITNSSFENRS